MKKKLSIALALLMSFALVACSNSSSSEDTDGNGNAGGENVEETEDLADEETDTFTVTFIDSSDDTVLHEEEVESGSEVPEFTPEKDGFTFMGWYLTPSLSHELEEGTSVTEDMKIFAGFASYAEDTREWSIVGNGTSPVLITSSWGGNIDENHKLIKEDVEGRNIFTITLDLESGDEWQLVINTDWDHQRGFGYLEDPGVTFTGSGGLGDTGAAKSNIKVIEPGNYTITLETFSAEDYYDTEDEYFTEESKDSFNYNNYDVITWVRNGDVQSQAQEIDTSYYIKGNLITGWKDIYEDEYKFEEQEDGTHILEIDLEEGDEFLFTSLVKSGDTESVGSEYVRYTNISEEDEESLAAVSVGDNANIIANTSGTYTFVYNPETEVLQVRVQ